MEGGATYAKKLLRQPLFEKNFKKIFGAFRNQRTTPEKGGAQATLTKINVNPFF